MASLLSEEKEEEEEEEEEEEDELEQGVEISASLCCPHLSPLFHSFAPSQA